MAQFFPLPFYTTKGLSSTRPDGSDRQFKVFFGFSNLKHFFQRRAKLVGDLAFYLVFFCITSYGQCPSTITTSAPVVTAASCPSSGQILIHSSAETEPSATYQIIAGPAAGGYQTTAQSSNNFTGLPAGNYTVRITCGTVTADVTATVADEYTPLNLTPAVTNVCATSGGGSGGSGGAGGDPGGRMSATTNAGAIITATATGGKAPLSYAFLLSNNAAEPDANFTYSSSNTFTAPSFGVYQVRVKDACNNFVTQSVDVQPVYPAAKLKFGYYNYQCAQTQILWNTLVREADGTQIDPSGAGYQLEMWYMAAGANCEVPATAADQTIIINSSSDLQTLNLPTTVQAVLIRTTSVCGEVTIECLPIGTPVLSSFGNVHIGCAPTDDVNLALDIYGGTWPYDVTVEGFDVAGNPVAGASTTFVFDVGTLVTVAPAHHYTYVVTDACGRTITRTIYTPTPADAPHVTWYTARLDCANTAGTVNVIVEVNGYIPNQDYSNIKLVNATTNAFVANSAGYEFHNGAIYFNNIPPGDYKVVFSNSSCPPSESPFTIPADSEVLVFALDGSTTQLCGGAGTITAVLNFNGDQKVSFQLLQGTTVIASNASGSFTNLAPGTYTLKAIVDMSSCGKPNMEATKDLTIQPEGSDPVVVKKLGINCTASAATGIAVFEFSGFGPFLLEMKKVTETTYTVIGSAVPNNYTAEGLAADTDYDVRITDQCGKTSVTQVSVKPLVAVYVTNSAQPCLDQPYTLSAEEITNASYSWTFNGGPVIATSKDIVFGSYVAANNGTYQCTITLGDCITKIVTVNLNSVNCSQPLAKSGLGDYVWNDTNQNGIQDAAESGVSGITVTLYGADGTSVLATTSTDANGYYSFPNLTAGSYVVGFSSLPSGYLFSSVVGTVNDANNSDADVSNGKTPVIALADNEFNMNIDAGIYYSLPVTLISFEAKALDHGALLTWSTATETNSDRFEIERSANGKAWTEVGAVRSHGESTTIKAYDFTDPAPLSGDSFYRLRMIDSDLTFSYSRIRHVFYGATQLVTVYPNPVSDMLYVKGIDLEKVKELSVLNASGERIFRSAHVTAQGIDVSHLHAGLYTVTVKGVDGKVRAFKVMVSK
ncbi:SdrD B-like domain-containing protein [Dyadobacter endophyticus]|uniref:SdrD B-like domain-containing protein n=1 Tax=Dyadobacter endophyticus TaxID=1749036 RepID=UPI001668F013|nr:SdrD B-like domain-containing protein [Dyadobacter endophyticus]